MRAYFSLILLAVAVGLTGCGKKDSNGALNSQDAAPLGAQEKEKTQAQTKTGETAQDIQAALQSELARAGVKIQWKDDGSVLVVEGFPYPKDLSGDYNIRIVKVENGVFVASKSSRVPTVMMGMVIVTAGGPFFAQCNGMEEGAQTIADAVGNKWVFAETGMSFDVYLPGSNKPSYALRSKIREAMISFTKEGVSVKGFEFNVSPGSSEPDQKAK